MFRTNTKYQIQFSKVLPKINVVLPFFHLQGFPAGKGKLNFLHRYFTRSRLNEPSAHQCNVYK